MLTRPVTSQLREFRPSGAKPSTLVIAKNSPKAEASSARDVEAELKAAFERGRAQGRSEVEEILISERQAHQAQADKTAADQARQWGEVLANKITLGLCRMRTDLFEYVAEAMRPAIVTNLKNNAVVALLDRMHSVLADRTVEVVVIRGPEPFLDAAKDALNHPNCRFELTEASDVVLQLDNTLLTANLGQLVALLEESK